MSNRKFQDADLERSIALPAADAAAESDNIDLRQEPVFPINEGFGGRILIPATPDLADDKVLTLKVEQSTSGTGSWSDVPGTTFTRTGAGGTGAASGEHAFRLPDNTKRYIRLNAAVEAAGGDNTGVSATLRLEF